MVVEVERLGTGWTAERRQPWWPRSVASAALPLVALGAGLGAFYFARVIPGSTAQATAMTMIGLACVSGIAAFATRWAHGLLPGRLSILSQAFDATPDAQLIAAPGGRMAYANTAFDHLFPGRGEPPLDRIARAVAADLTSQTEFCRLRVQAAAGARAIAMLSLRDTRGGVASRVTISANPIAGRPGYSLWNVKDAAADNDM